MARLLVVDANVQRRARRAIAHAREHPRGPIAMETAMETGRSPGDDPNHVVNIPIGVRCVFSIDWTPDGWMRHLSVSVTGRGKWPHPVLIGELMRLFEFRAQSMHHLRYPVWTEDHAQAVNLVERLDEY